MSEFTFDKQCFEVCDLGDEPRDLDYWLSRSPQERIAAMEFLRQVFYGYDPATARMERVLEIADLE